MTLKHSILSLGGLFLAVVAADVPVYGQCGGSGYTGSTVCTAGATCTSYNSYYYQCVPATATSVGSTTSAAATTTSSAQTTSSASTTRASTSQTSTVASSTTSSAASSSATQYFITFGDSYSQTGFDINSTLPSAANPLGNPAFPGYTTSGGANWIGFLVTEHNKSLLLSYNFAYGGATTDADIVPGYTDTVLSLVDQVAEFSDSIASHPASAPWTSENTLFGVWMGVNDVGNSYYQSNISDILDAIMVKYLEQLQIMYDAGGRNFVILTVPPINETPYMLDYSDDVRALESTIIAQYNDLLASNLQNFTSANTGVTAKIVDTTTAFQTVIDNPTAYGATNATCYDDDGTTCIWWNNYHPGLAIQELVAEEVADAWSGTFFT